jgi:Polyprenyl synthetase
MAARPTLAHIEALGADEWLAVSAAVVLAEAEDVARREAATPAQRSLLSRALRDTSSRVSAGGIIPCVHLPLIASVACGREAQAAVPLAVTATMIEAGANLLDNALDGELVEPWVEQPAMAMMAAVLHGGPLSRRALARAEAPPPRRLAVQEELDRCLLAIAAGQQRDLELGGREHPPTLDALLEAAAGKTGGRRGLEVRLAIVHAGYAPQGHPLIAFARAYGIARQLASDAADLTGTRPSRDLAARIWTWPLAWHAHRLTEAARTQFARRRVAAARDPALAAALTEEVRGTGSLLRTALEVRRWCVVARGRIDEISSAPSVVQLLDRLVGLMDP